MTSTFLVTGLTSAAGFVSGVVVARVLGPTLRGELAAVVVWASVLSMAGDLGIGYAVSNVVGRNEHPVSKAWTQVVLWAAGLGAVLAAAATLVVPATLHGATQGRLTYALGFSAIPFILGASYQGYMLLGAGLVEESNRVRLVAGLGYSAGVVAIALAGASSVGAFVAAYSLAQAASFITATVLVIRRFHPTWMPDASMAVLLLRKGAKNQIASLAAQATLRLDQLALSASFAPEVLGLYSVAVALASATGPVYSAGAILAIPHVLQSPDAERGSREVVRFLKLTAIVGSSISIVGTMVMPWLLPWLVGVSFRAAVLPAQILLVAGLFQGWNAILGNGLRALGRPGVPAVAEVLGVLVTVALLLGLLPRLGIVGAALASLVAYAGVSAVQMRALASGAGLSLGMLLRTPLALGQLIHGGHAAGGSGKGGEKP